MFTLFHFIFEFIRICFLSAIYGYILSPIVLNNKNTDKVKSNHRTALIGMLFISLFLWRFSYWRDNGLGDFGRVPLNSKFEITMIDFNKACLVNSEGVPLLCGIETLYLNDTTLYGYNNQTYFICNIKNGLLKRNLSKEQFISSLGKNEALTNVDQFHDDYWSNYLLLFL